MKISIIIPAKNEAKNLEALLPKIKSILHDAEIIVVNDGSTDNTNYICETNHIKTVYHPYPMGNGAAIKSGVRAAQGDILVLLDGDGQHNPEDIPKLIEKINQGYDMVVGARDKNSQASFARFIANNIYNRLSSWIVNQKIEDLTSGFRAINAKKFRGFLSLLPNGFSYPSTITMAFFRSAYKVSYIPITAIARTGKSHISPLRDGVRFLVIIFKIGTLYSPLKLFIPISFAHFIAGVGYYAYTYMTYSRFTNMSALLLIFSILIFLIGLISEQITTLIYKKND